MKWSAICVCNLNIQPCFTPFLFAEDFMKYLNISNSEEMDNLLKCLSEDMIQDTGREWLIQSHSSARFCFELSGNSN